MSNRTANIPQDIARQTIKILSLTDATRRHYGSRIDYLEKKINQWDSASWRVGLIGITSSGKSTLVNGLLGEKLLPAHVKPSSNCMIITRKSPHKKITKYHSGGKFENINKSLREELDKLGNELKNPGNSLNIEHLEMFSPDFKLDDIIELCDTPGLDAYNLPQHDEITLESVLPTLDLVIYVSTIRLIAQENEKIVKAILAAKKPLIWVLNCADNILPKYNKDGSMLKSKQEVAQEYLKKIRQNLSQAGIEESPHIPVLLVSSIQALQPERYNESGFDDLVRTIHDRVTKLSPKFVRGRLTQLQRELEEMKNEGKSIKTSKQTDYKALKEEFKETIQDMRETSNLYGGSYNKIQNDYNNKANEILEILDTLTNTSISKANELQATTNNVTFDTNRRLKNLILEMNKKIREIRKSLNIRHEDLHVMTNISPPDFIFNPTIIRQTQKEKVVEKGGFSGRLAKLFDSVLNTNWSIRRIHVEVEEIQNLEEYKHGIKSALYIEGKWLSDIINKSLADMKRYREIIEEAIHSKIQSLEEALKHAISSEEKAQIIRSLHDLIDEIKKQKDSLPELSHDPSTNQLGYLSSSGSDTSEYEIDVMEYKLMKLL